jgi:putative FmdB family regulatory protein
MPVYEYRCNKCGKEQEKFHKMDEENKENCEFCEAEPEDLQKLLSSFPTHVSWATWRVSTNI